jgi:hypothetical protein
MTPGVLLVFAGKVTSPLLIRSSFTGPPFAKVFSTAVKTGPRSIGEFEQLGTIKRINVAIKDSPIIADNVNNFSLILLLIEVDMMPSNHNS